MKEKLKTLIVTILTSSLVATGITALVDKNNEVETRTYELKYDLYSSLNEDLANLEDAIAFGSGSEIIEYTRSFGKKIPNVLLITGNQDLVGRLSNLRRSIVSAEEIKKEDVVQDIVHITVLLRNDFADYVMSDEEVMQMVNDRLSKYSTANLLNPYRK